MKIIGLTGGIGSGKTTVAGFFRELGIPVYIADEAGKRLMNSSPSVKQQLLTLFGPKAYKEDQLDNKYIASLVFASKARLQELNAIIHPAVEADFQQWKSLQIAPYVIYEAAILFESGGYKKCDKVILVTATYKERISRVQKRDESSIEEIEDRIAHQWSDEKKRNLANYEIINSELSFTKEQVQNLHQILLNPSKK